MRDGWEYKRFDEVFDLQMGKTPDRKHLDYFNGNNVWVSIRDLIEKELKDSNEHISDKAIRETKIRKVGKGTVLMSFKLTVGKCAIAGRDLYTNEAIMAFNLKEGYDIDSSFLYYYLQNYKWEGANKAVMGMTLNKATISKHLLSFPPIPQQRLIVSELDEINSLIALKREQLKKYDELAQSLFYEMFGDPIVNDKGWPEKRFVDVVKLQRGYDLPTAQRVDSGSIPVFGSNGILGYHNESKIESAIITGRSGTIGRVYVSKCPCWPLNTSLFSVETYDNNLIYLQYLLTAYDLSRFVEGAGVPTLNRNVFHNNLIMDCPIEYQHLFAQRIEQIEEQKKHVTAAIAKLETLLASRMQYWFE